jgi:ABC-type antimicrobial peptide transport system permease subunit
MSLGADRSRVVRMVVGRAMGVVLVGAVAGLGIAFILARLVQVFLLGISPGDPVTLVAGPLLLLGVALLAALLPAQRASRVNPVEALRGE